MPRSPVPVPAHEWRSCEIHAGADTAVFATRAFATANLVPVRLHVAMMLLLGMNRARYFQ